MTFVLSCSRRSRDRDDQNGHTLVTLEGPRVLSYWTVVDIGSLCEMMYSTDAEDLAAMSAGNRLCQTSRPKASTRPPLLVN